MTRTCESAESVFTKSKTYESDQDYLLMCIYLVNCAFKLHTTNICNFCNVKGSFSTRKEFMVSNSNVHAKTYW